MILLAFNAKYQTDIDVSDGDQLIQNTGVNLMLNDESLIKNTVYSDWTERDVQNWFTNKKIHANIVDALQPCDGKLLYEFYLMKNRTPDFFNESILADKSSFSLRDYAIFSKEINSLFENK